MTETSVINMRDGNAMTEAIQRGVFKRVDRATYWGNPFVIPKDGDRATVIAKYRQWIIGEKAMIDMARRELRGKVLGCWCKPQKCHADILAALVDGCPADLGAAGPADTSVGTRPEVQGRDENTMVSTTHRTTEEKE